MTEKKTYNPMSKEFQDECKRLGLTGRQLTAKYQKEGKSVKKEPKEKYKQKRRKDYTDKQLLDYPLQFEKENGRPPTTADFDNSSIYPNPSTYIRRFGGFNKALNVVGLCANNFRGATDDELLDSLMQISEEIGRPPTQKDLTNNPGYPSFMTYVNRFGSWPNALELVGLDMDTMIKKGIISDTNYQGRLFELYVKKHLELHKGQLENGVIDLSGKNHCSPFDGICPKGMIYDAKSSYFSGYGWQYHFKNKKKEDIEWYYLGAFNFDFTKLLHVWLIPGELVEDNHLNILLYGGKFNVKNMKCFEITDKFNFDLEELL